jgi:hypothetical protein
MKNFILAKGKALAEGNFQEIHSYGKEILK